MPAGACSGAACTATAAVLLAFLGGCSHTRQAPSPHDYVPRTVVELERLDLFFRGERIGELVRYEIQERPGRADSEAIRFWRVLSPAGAWIGHVSDQGRFSRRVPFRDEEQDLGIYPMAEGLAALIGVAGPVQLTAKPAAVEAAAARTGPAKADRN